MSSHWSHQIREACCLPPDKRTEEDLHSILDFVKGASKFLQDLDEEQQMALCRVFTLEEFDKGALVFDYGEVGDKFYIVLSGHFQVLAPQGPCPTGIHIGQCTCEDRPFQGLIFLERGMGFGELALQTDQPRSGRVVALERSELLVVQRAAYNTYAGEQHRCFIKDRVNFMRQCKCFAEGLRQDIISIKDLSSMASCIQEHQYTGQAVICHQGEAAENIFFVRSGRLLKLRTVDADCAEKESLQHRASSSSPRRSRAPKKSVSIFEHADSSASRASSHEDHHSDSSEETEADQQDHKVDSMVAIKKRHRLKMQARFERKMNKEASDGSEDSPRKTRVEPTLKAISSEMEQDEKEKAKAGPKKRAGGGSGRRVHSQPSKGRKRLLCVGKVDPYEYVGDQLFVHDQAWPVSLVTDAVANVYVLSKYDALRRISKKVFTAIFKGDTISDALPSDRQLLQMHRQTERWDAYRKSAQMEALSHCHSPTRAVIERDDDHHSRDIDVLGNLSFLGFSRRSQVSTEAAAPRASRKTMARATHRDSEDFVELSSMAMRRATALQHDRGLQNALRRSGDSRPAILTRNATNMEYSDYRLEQHWHRVAKEDPIMQALEEALDEVKEPVTPNLRKVLANSVSHSADGVGTSPRGGASSRTPRLPTLSRLGTTALSVAESIPEERTPRGRSNVTLSIPEERTPRGRSNVTLPRLC